MTDGDEPFDLQVIEDGEDVPGQLPDAPPSRAVALSVAAQIDPYDPPRGGEVGQLVVPAVPVGGPAVDEHQGRARTVTGPSSSYVSLAPSTSSCGMGGLLRCGPVTDGYGNRPPGPPSPSFAEEFEDVPEHVEGRAPAEERVQVAVAGNLGVRDVQLRLSAGQYVVTEPLGVEPQTVLAAGEQQDGVSIRAAASSAFCGSAR